MSKPICVIYFPNYTITGKDKNWIYDYMRFLNGDLVSNNSNYKPLDKFTDYHWFCFYKQGIEEPEFKVFYEKDFTEIQFNELKKIIIEGVSKQG